MASFNFSGLGVKATAQNAPEINYPQVTHNIKYLFTARTLNDTLADAYVNLNYPEEVAKFYEQRNYVPGWFIGKDIIAKNINMVLSVKNAEKNGLPSNDYHLPTLSHIWQQYIENYLPPTNTELAVYDVLLTDAWLALARHYYLGKLVPHQTDANWNWGYETLDDPNPFDPVVKLLQEIDGENPSQILEDFLPTTFEYAILQQQLLLLKNKTWPVIDMGGLQVLQKGQSHPVVAVLRERLTASGEFAADDQPINNPQLFDEKLEHSLMRFQQLNGLYCDGSLQHLTVQMLNISPQTRCDQIKANLERLRWQPRQNPEKDTVFIEVNIPSFELKYQRGNTRKLTKKVVVGRDVFATPILNDTLQKNNYKPILECTKKYCKTRANAHVGRRPHVFY
ncbi:MAG: hypothetical protein IPQ28_04535 [Sphingobacteriales bacterium]|nr:hypothetical protein [Sphingobacteriales bacterium]